MFIQAIGSVHGPGNTNGYGDRSVVAMNLDTGGFSARVCVLFRERTNYQACQLAANQCIK